MKLEMRSFKGTFVGEPRSQLWPSNAVGVNDSREQLPVQTGRTCTAFLLRTVLKSGINSADSTRVARRLVLSSLGLRTTENYVKLECAIFLVHSQHHQVIHLSARSKDGITPMWH